MSNNTENLSLEVCSACGVKIENGDTVLFSVGPPGTRSRLYARVCQYAKKPGCINKNSEKIGEIKPSDYYGDINDPSMPKPETQPVAAVVSGLLQSIQ